MTDPIMVDLRGTIPIPTLLEHAKGAFGYSGHNRAKCPSRSYGRELVAAGGWYAVVFEDSATRARSGYDAGRADAIYANSDADRQGYPRECVIFATADFDATWSEIVEYMHGWRDGSSRPIGLYADGDCIRAGKAAGILSAGWLTCSAGFHGSRDHTGVDVRQRCAGESGQIAIAGYSIDTNYVVDGRNFGAWGQAVTKPLAPPFDPPHYPGRILNVGDHGDDVEQLKVMLSNAGYRGLALKGSAVGRFGLGTRHAVARFQRRHGLTPVTGRPGPRTWDALRDVVIAKHNATGKG